MKDKTYPIIISGEKFSNRWLMPGQKLLQEILEVYEHSWGFTSTRNWKAIEFSSNSWVMRNLVVIVKTKIKNCQPFWYYYHLKLYVDNISDVRQPSWYLEILTFWWHSLLCILVSIIIITHLFASILDPITLNLRSTFFIWYRHSQNTTHGSSLWQFRERERAENTTLKVAIASTATSKFGSCM